MQYANGRDVRENINQQLKKMNIKLFDHYKQPFLMDVNEDEETHDELRLALKNGEYDKVEAYKEIRSYDLSLIDRSSGPGDRNEELALEYLKNIENRPGKWLRMCPGDERDVFQGIDLIKILENGTELTFQVKPFREVNKDNGVVTVSGIGNAKEYKVNYLLLVGQGKNSGNFLLINNTPQVKGKYSSYIFPENLLVRDSGNIVESFQLFKKLFIL